MEDEYTRQRKEYGYIRDEWNTDSRTLNRVEWFKAQRRKLLKKKSNKKNLNMAKYRRKRRVSRKIRRSKYARSAHRTYKKGLKWVKFANKVRTALQPEIKKRRVTLFANTRLDGDYTWDRWYTINIMDNVFPTTGTQDDQKVGLSCRFRKLTLHFNFSYSPENEALQLRAGLPCYFKIWIIKSTRNMERYTYPNVSQWWGGAQVNPLLMKTSPWNPGMGKLIWHKCFRHNLVKSFEGGNNVNVDFSYNFKKTFKINKEIKIKQVDNQAQVGTTLYSKNYYLCFSQEETNSCFFTAVAYLTYTDD